MDSRSVLFSLVVTVFLTTIIVIWYNSLIRSIAGETSITKYKALGPSLNILKLKSLLDFFPEAQSNAMNIVWSSRVNNRSMLQAVLKSDDIMMIEGDVTIGSKIGKRIPVMSEPPERSNDLTLHDFIAQTLQYSKGIMLDFKSTGVLQMAFDVLKVFEAQIDVPTVLNAFILDSPIPTSQPVDHKKFLHLCTEYFPWSIISLGWVSTCRNLSTAKGGSEIHQYTVEMVREMIELIQEKNIKQPIMFSLRSCMAVKAVDILGELLEEIPGSTLFLWSAENDPLNLNELRKLHKAFSNSVTYTNYPEAIRKELMGTL